MTLCIGLLTQYYPPESGAPQARLSDLARRFAERGHDVTVLTAMPNYPTGKLFAGYSGVLRREPSADGIRVVRSAIYPSQSARLVPRLASYFSFVGSSLLAGLATLPSLDYLVCESPPLFLGMTAEALSRVKRARLVFNVSDLWPDSAVRVGAVKPGAALRISEALERRAYERAWLVTCQTHGIVDDIRRRFPHVPTYHLPNGVDCALFGPDRRSPTMHDELRGARSLVAIYAGLHGLAQGLDQLLAAADRLRDLDLMFALVGDGPEKARLMTEARRLRLDNVRFFPARPRGEIPAMLASADIALVSLREGFNDAVPSKLYEALGSGLPVVAISEGEAARVLADADAGSSVRPNDIEALAAAIHSLAGDVGARRRLGENGRRAAVERFSRKAIGDAFSAHLEEA